MPVRAPSVCGYCGKAHVTAEPCAAVAKMVSARKARFDLKRPNSTARGYDRKWAAEAKAFLARPGNDLCGCGQTATLVRHIQSIRSRPDLRMDTTNWRPGCQRCNAIDAANERLTLKGT